MPELDFAGAQLAEEDRRTPLERLAEGAALAAIETGLFALFLIGITLEGTYLLLAYVTLVGLALYGWTRVPLLQGRFQRLLRRNQRLSISVLALLLISYPIVLLDSAYLIHVGALAAIFAIMALGLNITLGFCGLLDVGFAVYFAAGAYMSSQLAVNFGVPFWIGLPLGGLCAAFFGFLVAWPALRVHDHYLALVTLGYGLVMNLLHRNLTFLTNGTDGVVNIPAPSLFGFSFLESIEVFGWKLPFQINFYYLALALAGLTVLISVRLRDSNIGRQLEAIREDEIAARCFGVNVTRLKITAFSTGAFFGGIGGATFAHMISFVHPDNFVLLTSITILAMVIIGGMGNIFGVSLAAALLIFIPERLREFDELRMLLFGICLVLVMIYRPQGLFPNVRRRRELQPDQVLLVRSKEEDNRRQTAQTVQT